MKEFKFTINGSVYNVSVNRIEEAVADVEVNGTPYKVELDKPAKKEIKPLRRPQAAPTTSTGEPVVSRPAVSNNPGAVRSPLPGVILEMKVKVGDSVNRGQILLVLEAMKMENNINADRDGKVLEVKVNKGDSVLEGADLLVIG